VSDRPAHGFPWRITAVVALVVIASSVLAGVLLARDRVESVAPAVTSPATPQASAIPVEDQRQVTVLLTIRDTDRAAVSSVLIGVGGDTGFVAELMLPRDLLLPTVPPMRLEQATDPTGSQTAGAPLQTLLGVQVDAIMDLDRLAWTGLIDATGTPVDPDRAENPASFSLILDRVLSGLPEKDEMVGQLLTGLGSMARTTVPNEDVSHLLAVVGRDLRTQQVKRETLPVTYLRSGDARVAVTQQQEAQAVVAELFPGALLKPGHPGQLRVVLQRAGATVGAGVAARLTLAGAGFGVVEDRVTQSAATATAVYVPDGSEAARSAGADVAAALGLPASAVRIDDGSSPVVDVRVALGSDAGVS
jgi:hypothetical protein